MGKTRAQGPTRRHYAQVLVCSSVWNTIILTVFDSAYDILRYPAVTQDILAALIPALTKVDPRLFERVHIDGRYHGHIHRQEADVRAFMADESLLLDPLIDYQAVDGLSSEVKERLVAVRPATIVRSIPPFSVSKNVVLMDDGRARRSGWKA